MTRSVSDLISRGYKLLELMELHFTKPKTIYATTINRSKKKEFSNMEWNMLNRNYQIKHKNIIYYSSFEYVDYLLKKLINTIFFTYIPLSEIFDLVYSSNICVFLFSISQQFSFQISFSIPYVISRIAASNKYLTKKLLYEVLKTYNNFTVFKTFTVYQIENYGKGEMQ